MSTTRSPEPVPEHDYAKLVEAFETLAAAATAGPWITLADKYDENGRALCGPDGMEVVTDYLGPICSVGDPYPRSGNNPQENMELIAWCGSNRAGILAALRIARVVTAPTQEERFAIGLGAAGGECNQCGGLRGEWCEWALSRGSLAAIAKIAQGAGSDD